MLRSLNNSHNIAQQFTHSIKMNTKNMREKIQGGILAKVLLMTSGM